MERMKGVEDLNIRSFRAQGIVGVGVIIPTFTVLFPPAVCLWTTRGGSTRGRDSSCRSMFSAKYSAASSWMA
jgi:hypothetical protein